MKTIVSQGSAATHLRCDKMFNDTFVTQLLLSPTLKEYWKSVDICRSYCDSRGISITDTITLRCQGQKNSGLHQHHLRHFFVTVIRPVLEYCSVVWHHGLTKAQAESLESIQRRALRIIYPVTYDFPYDATLSIAQMASLFDRREQLNRHFFKSILSQSSCISSLLPPPRDLNVTSRLRTASTYPRHTTRTNVTPHLYNTDYYITKLNKSTPSVYSSIL